MERLLRQTTGTRDPAERYASYDFERTEGSALSMTCSPRLEGPDLEDREHLSMGALHSWGNVILRAVARVSLQRPALRQIDLGLAISHDAPIPGFRFIPSTEERDTRLGAGPALQQGQGMENVGDKTLYWYSVWRGDGQVRGGSETAWATCSPTPRGRSSSPARSDVET